MRNNFYKNKNVLVTGGTGLIGMQLVDMLIQRGAKVTVASIDKGNKSIKCEFVYKDLRNFENCVELCKGKEVVFQLAGIKGSPAMAIKKPASFMVPTIIMSLNMLEAARISKVRNFLITSSVGVYSPAEVFNEEDVWKTFPSNNDKFAGWAKRLTELQAEAFKIEHQMENISIVRPANVFGPYDNFDPENAMVIPSLITKAINSKDKFTVWGDGSAIRDFIYSRDVANGMILAIEKNIKEPINLGSGKGITIREIVEIINNFIPNGPKEIIWDTSKPAGDKKRIMNTEKAISYGIYPQTSLEEGIKNTISWYEQNKNSYTQKYNVFKSIY